jgi:succinoglycan biosynthesis transport protein ExoP
MSTMSLSVPEEEAQTSSLNFNDILFILFKHKWKILLCTAVGLAAAGAVYFLFPPLYESEAKLLVKYVVERSAVDKLDAPIKTPDARNEDLINSEVQILTSSDVAVQVAEAVGVERLVQRSEGIATAPKAARNILKGLSVTALKDSNIILVSYRNEDPNLATQVLQEVVKHYFDKHLEVHRSVGSFDLMARETDQLRARLNQTDEELKQLKAKAGITSLAESTAGTAAELTKAREDAANAEAELAAQQARVKEIEGSLAGAETARPEKPVQRASTAVVQQYQVLVSRLTQLHQIVSDLLSRYTPQNRIVKVKQEQIADLESQRQNLEKEDPSLLATIPAATAPQSPLPDLMSEKARLMGLEARTETLRRNLSAIQERAKLIAEYSPRIGELERSKEVDEANYKYYQASLEKARADETLDPSRMPNISIVQKPLPAAKTTRDLQKVVLGLAGGGLATGLAIALLIELVLDRTVKRSFELERGLRIPLLLSIPYLPSGGRRLYLHDAGQDSDENFRPEIDSADSGQLLRPFCEAIRDRLGLYFELNKMEHKPKLVAVAGLSRNAGASTLAAGLAESLTETSEGKVLLVDKPFAPKRFYDMMQQFKASDLNYVVFDMPSLGDTSATLPMTAFMDKVLLVVEAEKSNLKAVRRAYSQLAAKTDVSVVFNKSRSYGPKWLEGEL